MKQMQPQRYAGARKPIGASADYPGEVDLESYLRRGRELRAQALRASLGAIAQALAALARRAYRGAGAIGRRALAGAKRAHERRRATRALLELDDRLLKDIGLTRGQIHAAVDGLFSSPPSARANVLNFRQPPKRGTGVDHLESAA